MGNGLSTDQGSFTPHGLRDVSRTGAEQRQHNWSNPEEDNMLAGAPNNEEINSLSTFNNTRLASDTCNSHTTLKSASSYISKKKSEKKTFFANALCSDRLDD